MCGRYYIADPEQEREIKKILDQIDRKQRSKLKTGEIFPSNYAPIIKSSDQVYPAQWGFPRFAIKGVIMNARSETAAEKTERPILHPIEWFIEWFIE